MQERTFSPDPICLILWPDGKAHIASHPRAPPVIQIILVATGTLLASFLCSLFEAVLYSIRPARVQVLSEEGRPGAKHLAKLKENVEEPIAAILTVNTIAHTVGSAWCGAMVGKEFGSAAVGIFAAIFTVLVLAVTEIIPKSLGIRYAGSLGTAIVRPLQVMIWTVWPIVWISTKVMALWTGSEHEKGPTEAEVVVFAGLAEEDGAVRKEERRWIENALRLDQVSAGDLRTPRTVVQSLPADASIRTLTDNPDRWIHSRVPVTEGDDPDAVIGLIYRRDIFDAVLQGAPKEDELRSLMHPIRFVPETMPAHALLDMFLKERVHMVAVADEYGGFEGVVTLEDVLECLLGEEIVDEHDEIRDMQEHAMDQGRKRQSPDGQA